MACLVTKLVTVTTTTTLTAATTAWTDEDRLLMAHALDLARRGLGRVSPGPLVGCVIVDAAGEVVGEGFYVFEDLQHAETIALAQAGDRARGGTAYVSLEPHAHHGRTPPCTDALIASGIKRVVAPIQDLNPKVSGKGFEHLLSAGIAVQTGLLSEEATQVNEAYLHYMRTGRPFVHLKLAVSLDGKIATRTGDSRWVAGPESRQRVQELRYQYDGILVGVGTAKMDDPLLTDRSELPRRRSLVRIVLDENVELPPTGQLANTAAEWPVVVFAGVNTEEARVEVLKRKGVDVVQLTNRNMLPVLEGLGRRSLQSVLVEGGSAVAGAFIDSGLVNKVTFFIAPKVVGGVSAPGAIGGVGIEKMSDAVNLERVTVKRRGDDIEVTGYCRAATE